jgi:hypothetical protein
MYTTFCLNWQLQMDFLGGFNPNTSDPDIYIKHKHWATKFKDVL